MHDHNTNASSSARSNIASRLFPAMVLATCGFATAQQPPRYVISEIPALGGLTSRANDINNKSQVVGQAETADFAPPPYSNTRVTRAFLWENETMTVLSPLAAPEPYWAVARAISDAGHVVGSCSFYLFGMSRAVMWHNSQVTDLGVIANTDHCFGNGVNNLGVIVGSCTSDYGGSGYAFQWSVDAGQTIIIGPIENNDASANGIDSRGQIVGGHGELFGAFMWNQGNFTPLENGPYGAQAEAINENNEIVGWTTLPGVVLSAFRWSNGVATPLGTLGGSGSRAMDVNDRGWIVGAATNSSNLEHAFVWIDGQMHDLNDLTASGSGWVLTTAEGINNANEIVGWGISSQNHERGFILRPAEPGDANGDGNVNVVDLLSLINSWGPCPALGYCFVDFNFDGIVNVSDLLLLIENWG